MKPNILNPAWKYTSSEKTNLSLTFKRVRKEMKEAELKQLDKIINIRGVRKG